VRSAKSLSAKVFCLKIILAIRSTEFCQCTFDEGDIREALGGDGGHTWIILLEFQSKSKDRDLRSYLGVIFIPIGIAALFGFMPLKYLQ
jgi:hypothetical protein